MWYKPFQINSNQKKCGANRGALNRKIVYFFFLKT